MCTENIKINKPLSLYVQLNRQVYQKNSKGGNISISSHLAIIFMCSLVSCVPDYSSLWTSRISSKTAAFCRQILEMILPPSAADKWLMVGGTGEKESNTDRETIFHFAQDLFFIEFLAPLFPSLLAKSFPYCLEDGKTQVGGRRRLIFQQGSSLPMT